MPLYKLTVSKRMILSPEEKWTNVYTINAPNPIDVLDIGEGIADFEAGVMGETAEVFRLDARFPGVSTGASREFIRPGLQTVADPDTRLPQWNTVKVTFTNAVGRPEIKYLRLPLYIDMVDGQTIKTAVQTSVQLGYTGPVNDVPEFVGPSGEVHTGGSTASLIQMRQTDWHRRTRVGFKRGWVPV